MATSNQIPVSLPYCFDDVQRAITGSYRNTLRLHQSYQEVVCALMCMTLLHFSKTLDLDNSTSWIRGALMSGKAVTMLSKTHWLLSPCHRNPVPLLWKVTMMLSSIAGAGMDM